MIGRLLSHYRVLEKIGSGGMGDVYLAEDLRLHRRVALKLLSEDSRANRTRAARFEREMQAIAAINHPNVVTLYAVEESEGRRFLAMEWVDGTTLADSLGPGQQLTLHRFLDIALPLADGLGAAHRLGIAHRDLKPRNVMIDRQGRVKLLDFGLAAWLERRSWDSSEDLTHTGAVVGTPAYMSPEQLVGGPAEPSSDVFALGVLFYELLAGRRPFAGATPSELATGILRDAAVPLREQRPDLPVRLGAMLHRCLEKHAADRPTVEQVSQELREVQLESQVELLSGQFAQASRRRQRRLVTFSWIALAVALAAGIGGGLWWARRGRAPAFEPSITPLATWSGVQADSQLSPDGRFVSFLDSQFGPGNVFLQRIEGGPPQRLAEDAGLALSHLWSEDAQHVALLVQTGNRFYVQVRRPYAAGVERVMPLAAGVHYRRLVRWRGDLLYVEGSDGLTALDQASGDLEAVLGGRFGDFRQSNFDLSPGGDAVVFERAHEGRVHVWTRQLASGREVELTRHDGNDTWPHWIGPDGSLVTVTSDRSGRSDLWVVPVEHPERASPLLLGAWDEEIDSTSFERAVATFRESSRSSELRLLDPSSRPDTLTVGGELTSVTAPSVARQVGLLAFQRFEPRAARAFFPFGSQVMVATIGEDDTLDGAREIGQGALPEISPSGQWVAYVRKPEQGFEVVAYELRSGIERVLCGSFALAGIDAVTLEPVSRRLLFAPGDRVYFIESSPEGQALRRWRAGSDAAPAELARVGAPGELDDLVAAGDGGALFLRSPTPRHRGGGGSGEIEIAAVGPDEDLASTRWRVPVATGERAFLLGLLDGRPVVALRRQNDDWTSRMRLVVLESGALRELGTVERANGTGAVIDAAGQRLVYSARDARTGAFNLFELSLPSGDRRQLTFNRRPGMLFVGAHPLEGGRVLFAAVELASTVNVLELQPKG